MKQSVIFAALGLAAFGVAAQETGTVISSTPVVRQVAVPQQVCGQAYAPVPAPTSGGGALLGAIAGAAIGSTIGGGVGQAAAIGLGAVAGGAVGNSIESSNNARFAAVPTCTTQMSYENRTVGYDVTYEYNGRRYQAQLPTDPGPTIRLRVTPVGEVRPMMRMYRGPAMAGAPVTAPPMQYAQQQPMPMQQQMPMQQPMPMQPADAEPSRNYGEAVPPEQERQGTSISAAESGNAVMYGQGYPYGYAYPSYPAYPAYPAYGYGYPAVYGAAVVPVVRPYYRPWAGYYRPWGGYYRPWGGYYRPWAPRPWGGVSFGFGYSRWR